MGRGNPVILNPTLAWLSRQRQLALCQLCERTCRSNVSTHDVRELLWIL